jgi:uncharacterized membrane protein
MPKSETKFIQPGGKLRANPANDIFPDVVIGRRPASVTIGKPVEQISAFLANPKNFPLFMKDVKSCVETKSKMWHWISTHGKEWDTELVSAPTPTASSWRIVGDDDAIGAVTIEPAVGGRGSIVSMKVAHEKILEGLTGWVASMVGQNENYRAALDLRRLKAFLETGECPTTDGQPSGRLLN